MSDKTFEIPSVKAKICGNSGAIGVPMDVYRKVAGKDLKVTIEVIEGAT